jgi:MFS superfamily sulfate permease-like transporter
MKQNLLTKPAGSDFSASIVTFLVALPLCLGIALASGAPLISGLIAGIIGGIVVGVISGSHTSVSGPAAGLAIIVLTSIQDLGSFPNFLAAVVIAGFIQLAAGFLGAGIVGNFVPSSVIKGMLASIGLVLIFKQIPQAVGFDKDYIGDENFEQLDGHNTFSELLELFSSFVPGALAVGLLCFLLMVLNEKKILRLPSAINFLPFTLVIVLVGLFSNYFILPHIDGFALEQSHLVTIPDFSTTPIITLPHWGAFTQVAVIFTGIKIAIVASLETLLSVEATDKLDPDKRMTPTSRELVAQGIGNVLSGLVGGLPITAVIVRSSASIQAGAKTKNSAIIHGVWLLAAVLLLRPLLNYIPLSSLAIILLFVGYKLTKPDLYKEMLKKGKDQYVPFLVTVIIILFTDLLTGVAVGMIVAFYFIIRSNFKTAISITRDGGSYLIRLKNSVNFINRVILKNLFERIPEGSYVIIDGSTATYLDMDIIETLDEFITMAPTKNITIELKKARSCPNTYFRQLSKV